MYVVTGATGHTGSAAARTLIARGAKVRVVVRDAARGREWAGRGAEVAVADLADAAAMAAAFTGAEGAYLLNPPAYEGADPFAAAETVGRALRRAIETSRLPKAVVLSSVGAHLSSGTGIIRTSHLLEQRLRDADVPVTFVRASYFMENWAAVAPVAAQSGVLPSFLAPLDRAIPMVATQDIGRVTAEALLESAKGVRVIELSGPREYSPGDVAAAFARALGRPVRAVLVPEKDWAGALAHGHLSPSAVDGFAGMFRAVNAGVVAFEGKGATPVRGRVTLEEAVKGIAAGGTKG